jgi:hypothetical protein
VASMSITIRSGVATGVPGVLARPRASGAQHLQQRAVGGDRIDHPKRRRVRGNLSEQRLLVTHGAQVGEAVAAVGQHHRQVADDAAGIMSAAPLTRRGQPARERPRQAQPIGPCLHRGTRIRSDVGSCEGRCRCDERCGRSAGSQLRLGDKHRDGQLQTASVSGSTYCASSSSESRWAGCGVSVTMDGGIVMEEHQTGESCVLNFKIP